MFKPKGLSDNVLFSTVRIEVRTPHGTGTGTGFFYDHYVNETEFIPLIITNRHVIEGATQGEFHLHEATVEGNELAPKGSFFTIHLDNFQSFWTLHPHGLDLAAMPFRPLEVHAESQQKLVFRRSFSHQAVASQQALEDLNSLEQVVMTGYPNGLWDNVNNLPLTRMGVTANHPSIDYCGDPVGVIDAACFPGSSGSPVMILNEGMYANRQGTTIGNRLLLLGALFQGPIMTAEGSIEMKEIPLQTVPVAKTQVMINLGYYIKAREIVTLAKFIEAQIKR